MLHSLIFMRTLKLGKSIFSFRVSSGALTRSQKGSMEHTKNFRKEEICVKTYEQIKNILRISWTRNLSKHQKRSALDRSFKKKIEKGAVKKI